jgi:hypothetical protein
VPSAPEALTPPDQSRDPSGFPGSKIVFIAGQEPEDAEGNALGPGDLAAQAGQVSANLGHALAAGGASPAQFFLVHRVQPSQPRPPPTLSNPLIMDDFLLYSRESSAIIRSRCRLGGVADDFG